MKSVCSRLFAGIAAAGLAIAPVAAQANTRAGDNSNFYSQSALSNPGAGRVSSGSQLEGEAGGGVLIALLGFAAIIGALVVAGGSGSNGAN